MSKTKIQKSLQSNPFQNPGSGPPSVTDGRTDGRRRMEILVSNIGFDSFFQIYFKVSIS